MIVRRIPADGYQYVHQVDSFFLASTQEKSPLYDFNVSEDPFDILCLQHADCFE